MFVCAWSNHDSKNCSEIKFHDDDVHDGDDHGDDDDDVTDCEEVNLRGRTRTNAPSESLTAADWLKRALSEHDDEDEDDNGNGFGEEEDGSVVTMTLMTLIMMALSMMRTRNLSKAMGKRQ